MRHVAVPLAAAFVWLLAPAAPAKAEFIPWKYNWSRSPSVIAADAPGTGSITLTDESLKSAAGDSDIVATNIKVASTATANNPDVFTNKSYTLTMLLLDVESNQSATLAFTGLFNGTVTAFNAKIRNTFTSDTTRELILGENRYTVTIGPFVPPGPPTSDNAGAISAFAQVSVTDIHKSPEPSTLVLAVVGLPFAGWVLWRRRWAGA